MLRTGGILVLAACGGHTSVTPCSETAGGGCPSRIGDRTLYTVAASDSIAAPQTCARNQPEEAYIRISGRGTRPFSVSSPGKATGCTAPDGDCETVDLGAFLQAVGAKLRARGIDPVGTIGMGTCGKVGDGVSWQDRHMSIIVYHWNHANAAVALLDEELRAWQVSQSYEVSVEHMRCSTHL